LGVTSAFAGDKGGNGGDVVVCDDSVRLLDHVEGEARGIYYNLGASNQNYQEHLDEALNRLGRFSDELAAKFEEKISKLTQDIEQFRADINADPSVAYERNSMYEVVNFTTDNLVDIPDSDHSTIPRGCAVEQIAVQKTPKFIGERLYTIDKKLFFQLDEAGVAGLVLHEIIYQDYIQNAWSNNSTETRSLNTIISSDKILDMGFVEFLQELERVEYRKISLKGAKVETKVSRVYVNGSDTIEHTLRLASRHSFKTDGKVKGWLMAQSPSKMILNSNGDWKANPFSGVVIKGPYAFMHLDNQSKATLKGLNRNFLFEIVDNKLLIDNETVSKWDENLAQILFGLSTGKAWADQTSYGDSASYGDCRVKKERNFWGKAKWSMHNGIAEKKLKRDEIKETMLSGFCE
ncbi:MAG: hypothetical protein WEB87_05205, partial [Bacteriovoracaceae bacterium]